MRGALPVTEEPVIAGHCCQWRAGKDHSTVAVKGEERERRLAGAEFSVRRLLGAGDLTPWGHCGAASLQLSQAVKYRVAKPGSRIRPSTRPTAEGSAAGPGLFRLRHSFLV